MQIFVALLILGLASIAPVRSEDSTRPDFAAWISALRIEALQQNVSAATFDAALGGTEPLERVIELDRNQPEGTISFERYLKRVIDDRRVRDGRRRMEQHRELLARIHERYGVQPRFLVALWGIESDYGRHTGGFSVIDALATLAYDGRRGAFFRRELLDALAILEGGHIEPERMLGSWAGAMGQAQFMPSTFRRFAVDHDRDSRKDIWGSTADALASAANYLASSGWRDDLKWGRRVRLPDGFDRKLIGRDIRKSLGQWRELGLRRADGSALPQADVTGWVVTPDGADGAAYLVYHNFGVLLEWNRSDYFATAVGLLSDRLR